MDDGIEAAVLVRSVLHSSDGAIRLHHRVLPFDHIAIASFVLALDVAGVVIVDAILEGVLWGSLKNERGKCKSFTKANKEIVAIR